MMDTLKPRPRRAMPIVALFALVAVASGFGIWQMASDSQLSLQGVIEALVSVLIVGLILVGLLLDEKRNRSVELTEDGVSALVWKRNGFPLVLALERKFVAWADVRRLGMRGATIWIDDGKHRIPIHTLLFKDPNRVAEFINERSKIVRDK